MNKNELVFTTERLSAYLIDEHNKHYVIDLYNQKENIEFLEGIDAEMDIALSLESYELYQKIGAYLIFENATGKFIGIGGVQKQEPMVDGSFSMSDFDLEFLIIMHKEFGGKGYAFEFCEHFFKKLFEIFPEIKIPARVDKKNVACMKLLKKLGFREVGEVDYHIYGNKFSLFLLLHNSVSC